MLVESIVKTFYVCPGPSTRKAVLEKSLSHPRVQIDLPRLHSSCQGGCGSTKISCWPQPISRENQGWSIENELANMRCLITVAVSGGSASSAKDESTYTWCASQ